MFTLSTLSSNNTQFRFCGLLGLHSSHRSVFLRIRTMAYGIRSDSRIEPRPRNELLAYVSGGMFDK